MVLNTHMRLSVAEKVAMLYSVAFELLHSGDMVVRSNQAITLLTNEMIDIENSVRKFCLTNKFAWLSYII